MRVRQLVESPVWCQMLEGVEEVLRLRHLSQATWGHGGSHIELFSKGLPRSRCLEISTKSATCQGTRHNGGLQFKSSSDHKKKTSQWLTYILVWPHLAIQRVNMHCGVLISTSYVSKKKLVVTPKVCHKKGKIIHLAACIYNWLECKALYPKQTPLHSQHLFV